ncbi:MAG: hypothetical protein AAFX92_06150 [Pseudomonadota bacterium]
MFVVVAVLALAACTSRPSTIEGPQDSNMITVMQDPLFSRLDAESLVDLAAFYPATGGDHTIPMGDYVGSRLVRELSRREGIERLSVGEFDVDCDSIGAFGPRVACEGAMALEVVQDGREATYSASVFHEDVGQTYLRAGNPSPIDAIILDQVVPVVDELVNAVVSQVP